MCGPKSSNGMSSRPPKPLNCHFKLAASTNQRCLLISLLAACASLRQLSQVHAHLQTSGLLHDAFLATSLIRFCSLSPFGSLDYAGSLLRHSHDRLPTSSWNLVIRGYSYSDRPRQAIVEFGMMQARGVRPDKMTFPFLLKACAKMRDLEAGKQIKAEILKNGIDSDVYIQNTMICFYGACSKISAARKVFDGMSVKTVVSWNAIISAHVENMLYDESAALFVEMVICGFQPDCATIVILLSACAELGNLALGHRIHSNVVVQGLDMNVKLGTALVTMYAKCGSIDCALRLFKRMSNKNVWTWSAMILGLAQHGRSNKAIQLYSEMKRSGVEPNYVTFLGIMCACSHSGLVGKGYQFFHDMVHVHRIHPTVMHYGAMVDILGRNGRLEEAYDFILNMPIAADGVVWRTLLSACLIHDSKSHGDVEGKVRKKLLELEPTRCGNYVMVANLFAEGGLWDEAADVSRMMRECGLKKMAGESCIEVGGSIYRFLSGDVSAIDHRLNIDCLLDVLYLHMKFVGYDESHLTFGF